eukprot:TRINITY_DN9962_c0_g1_i10.p1 TRINITY_DN9962_c0_g1~~TRINITY_DN9962_c0_g1_i10.p1  ORF type:complete len:417 (-),score=103.13 TRINITY_DN9962_c0_g1_i10:52-1302(-)
MSFSSSNTRHRPAGVTTIFKDTAASCIKPDESRAETPEHIRRYRKSFKQREGVSIQHYGRVNDPLPAEKHFYGVPTKESDHTNQVLNVRPEGFREVVNDLKEAKYASAKREPLGRPIERNYKYPDPVLTSDFRFGVPTVNSENTAKEVIFGGNIEDLDEETRLRYIKSHGMFEPGEKRNRNYNWKVDPEQHRFGLTQKDRIKDEAKLALQPEANNNVIPKTTIVKKNVEDHRDFRDDPLGRPKNLGQENPYIGKEHVFGYRPKYQDEWDVAKCLRGEATLKELGRDTEFRATKQGVRNEPRPGHDARVFGVPSLRTDIPKPKAKSVADPNNYGDEASAVQLLFPQKFAELGISPEDFKKLRPKEEIRDIFSSIGILYKPGKFEGIFLRAREIDGAEYEEASVRGFLQAVSEMHNVE